MEQGRFQIFHFASGQSIEHHLDISHDGHGGGDERFVRSFVNEIRNYHLKHDTALTSATASLQSHLIAFAAEQSRLTGGMPIELQ